MRVLGRPAQPARLVLIARSVALPAASLIPLLVLSYLLLLHWTSRLSKSVSGAYAELSEGSAASIGLVALTWVCASLIAFFYQEFWVWGLKIRRAHFGEFPTRLRLVRSGLFLLGWTSATSFPLLFTVSFALYNIDAWGPHVASFLVFLLGVFFLLAWLILVILKTVRRRPKAE